MESRISPQTVAYSPIGDNDSNLKQVKLELLTRINEVAKEVHDVAKEVHDVRDKNNGRIELVKNFLDYLKKEVIKLKECCDTKGSSSAKSARGPSVKQILEENHGIFDNALKPQVSSSAATSSDISRQQWDQLVRSDPRWAKINEEVEASEEIKRNKVDDTRKATREKKGGKNKKTQTRKRRKTKHYIFAHLKRPLL
mgnify:CR=1 FL=1